MNERTERVALAVKIFKEAITKCLQEGCSDDEVQEGMNEAYNDEFEGWLDDA